MKARLMGVLALLFLLPLAACDDSTAVQDEGTLTLLITDYPAFDEVWVTVESIYLVGEGGEVNVFPGDLDPVPDPDPINLLALHNDALTLVHDLPVGPGTFSQLRIVVSEACVADGDDVYATSTEYKWCGDVVTGDLQNPSYNTSGFKIQLPGGSMTFEGGRSIILVDFVVPESFARVAGKSNKVILRPHVKATRIEFSGTLLVELDATDDALLQMDALGLDPEADLGEFVAQLYVPGDPDWMADGMPVAFTDDGSNPGDVADDGIYTAFFDLLVPGPYQVELLLPARDGLPESDPPFAFELEGANPVDVTIDDSEDDTAGFVVNCAYEFGADSPCTTSSSEGT